ncbi:minor capsid protein [Burkholderia phage vB_BglM_WTB]
MATSPFQQQVNRNYTSGFVGEIAHDGPMRLKPGRIASATGNTVGRVFGYSGDAPATGVTLAAFSPQVVVGGAVFYGVLSIPKHYALFGTSQGPLAASYNLPEGTDAEFADMAILHGELFNETTAVKAVSYGDSLAYVSTATTAAQNPQGLPLGAIVSVPAGADAPAGFTPIPNSRVINPISLAASGANPVSGVTKIQLTQ